MPAAASSSSEGSCGVKGVGDGVAVGAGVGVGVSCGVAVASGEA